MFKRSIVSLAVVTALACAAPAFAFAQVAPRGAPPTLERPAQPTPPHPRSPRTVGVTGATQNVIRTPRFIVEAVSFTAVNESGIDWPTSSDEVIAIFADLTTEHDHLHYTMRTHEFDQVDTGDTVQFPYNESCIVGVAAPTNVHHLTWLCDPHGAQAPLSFSIRLVEADSAVTQLPFPGFCVSSVTYGPINQDICYGNVLFDHTFTYSLSALMPRVNNACRCFTETAEWRPDDHTDYRITFRVTRVDEQGPPLTLDPHAGASGPVVLTSGTLTAPAGAAFELDGAAVVSTGGDFDFDRRLLNTFELDAPGNAGASIWLGGAAPRGYAACNAARGSANYVSSAVTVPANGSYACYITDQGHVGEMRIDLLSPADQTLTISFTTWQ